ncbi:MAG: aquaporin [Fretibacterium sp.]|nr:aquaporin [Fretibacterium sp.]
MKKYLAEFIGTLVLVLFGCGTAVVVGCNGAEPNAAYLMTALAFGLSIVAMAYSIGNVSGCHVNPAVSIGVLLTGGMGIVDFVCYVIAQCAGALAGAAIRAWFVGVESGLGTNALSQGDVVKSLAIEGVLTCAFVLTILGVTSRSGHNKFAGLVIGLTLTLIHIFGIHFTGTSVNPARSFGPAFLVQGAAWADLWVFVAAPLAGGIVAAIIWKIIEPAD